MFHIFLSLYYSCQVVGRGSKAYLKEKWTYGARMKIVFSWNFLLYAFIPIFRTSCFLKKSICPFSLTVRQVVMGGRRRCHYKVRRVAFQKGKVKSTRCTPQQQSQERLVPPHRMAASSMQRVAVSTFAH